MKAYFRTEASESTGAGHLMRCLALAQALEQQHIECCFVVPASTRPFCLKRHDWNFSIIDLPDNLSLQQEIPWLKATLGLQKRDLLILDSYKFDELYMQSAAALEGTLVLFDDCNNRGKLHADIILNSAGGAAGLGYESTAPESLLCLGEQYRLLRQEFLTEMPQPLNNRTSLTIVMGGTDVKGLSLAFLQELADQKVDIPIRLVCTSDNPRLSEIKDCVAGTGMAVQLVIDSQDLASIFSHSRLTISAAGTTQFELLAMHCPSLLLVVADNQLNAARASEQQGWCRMVDFRNNSPIAEVVAMAKTLWHHPNKLQQMHDDAALHADLEGASRILDKLSTLSEREQYAG